MSKMIQIRNVPDHVHRRLKARAAEEGTSLSDYCLREIRRIADLPTREELFERLRRLGPIELSDDPVEVLRAEREARTRRLGGY